MQFEVDKQIAMIKILIKMALIIMSSYQKNFYQDFFYQLIKFFYQDRLKIKIDNQKANLDKCF